MTLSSEFVDINRLQTKLKKFELDTSGNDDILQEGINSGDNFIHLKVDTSSITDIPQELIDASTLWALRTILIDITLGDGDPPKAVTNYETEAQDIIDAYLAKEPDEQQPDGASINLFNINDTLNEDDPDNAVFNPLLQDDWGYS